MTEKAKIVVGKEEVMELLEGESGAVRLMSREVVSERLLKKVLTLCAGVTMVTLLYWMLETYLHPSDADAIVDRTLRIYEGMLTKTWMPVITTLIGVFIGQRMSGAEPKAE